MEEPKLKIQIISTETIKPSSPTPDNLRIFNLCTYDQFIPPIYVGLVFFYPHEANGTDRHHILKSSLSETLTRFYPLAGRTVEGNLFIDCNDAGADYVEARVTGTRLSDILRRPDPKLLLQLLPISERGAFAVVGSGCLVLVQANVFDCGGMALSTCFCHKVADMSTIRAFVKGWAATARGCSDTVVPEFNLASRFPAVPSLSDVPVLDLKACKCSTRRCVFNAAKITSLKAKSASERVARGPTRVEAVTALVWKCIMEASGSTPHRPCIVGHQVNLRKRLNPPLSEYSVGNLVGAWLTRIDGRSRDREMELRELTSLLMESLEDVKENYVKRVEGEDGLRIIGEAAVENARCITSEDEDYYIFSSWCRLGLYDADFGWGRPAWIGLPGTDVKNLVFMMDTIDGYGIEVWVTLPEQDMAFFETNPMLLEFASLNPSILF